jgi:hypothetical protein
VYLPAKTQPHRNIPKSRIIHRIRQPSRSCTRIPRPSAAYIASALNARPRKTTKIPVNAIAVSMGFHPDGSLLNQGRTQAHDTRHDSLSGLIEDEVLTGKAGGCQLRQAIPGRLKVGGAVKPNRSSVRVFPEKVKWGDLHGRPSTALGANR